jgi:hypothetical protein
MGTSVEALARMSNVAQLEYVKRFFRPYLPRIRPDVPGDYYLAVFMPKYIGYDYGTVLFRAGETGYTQNRGLDRNGDGLITVGDVVGVVEGVVEAARARPPIEVSVGVSMLAWMVGGIVMVLGGAAVYQERRKVRTIVERYVG